MLKLYMHRNQFFIVKTNPCSRYEGKTGEERNLVIFEDVNPSMTIQY